MQENGSPRRRERRNPTPTNAEEDRKVQRALLALILREHPTQMTFPDLARELFDDPDDFLAGDALARAVRDLAAIGLLQSNGLFVLPTRAALHFHVLMFD